ALDGGRLVGGVALVVVHQLVRESYPPLTLRHAPRQPDRVGAVREPPDAGRQIGPHQAHAW
ncbi:hypothetical protein ACTQVS_09580, partial [Anaerovoracaceae bacterium HCP3S3_H6]